MTADIFKLYDLNHFDLNQVFKYIFIHIRYLNTFDLNQVFKSRFQYTLILKLHSVPPDKYLVKVAYVKVLL